MAPAMPRALGRQIVAGDGDTVLRAGEGVPGGEELVGALAFERLAWITITRVMTTNAAKC